MIGPLVGGVIGAMFFLWIAGWRVVNPAEFQWLMKLDWRINFLGWHLFRNDPWQLPPGRITGYLAGEGTTIGFTDSVPLAALLLKPFDPWLPTPFQYFGVWLLVCYALQGLFGALIARVYTSNSLLQAASAALFVLIPTLLIRVGHPALMAHFVLLWGMWLYLASDRQRPASTASQVSLGFIVGLIHPYLAAMTLALVATLPIRDRTRHAVLSFAATVLATVAAWWIAGFISVSNSTDLSAGGLGLYSMNLLAPITPHGWSTLLPEWPIAHEYQAYEGFQYLGLGFLALLVVALVIAINHRGAINWGFMLPLLALCVLTTAYALSPRVTVGERLVLDWTSPAIDRLAFFRASGRFFWPTTYVLLGIAVAMVVSRLRPAVALTVLVAAIALQAFDQRRAHAERRITSRSDAFHAWPRRLMSPVWHDILPHYQHVLLVPASQCGGAPLEHEEAAYLAGLHGLTINSGLGARWDEVARRRYCGALDVAMGRGVIDDHSVYIVTPAYEERLRAAPQRVVCGSIDGARVCVTDASYQAWRDTLPMSE